MKNKLTVLIFAYVLGALTLACFLKPDTIYSEGERRPLAESPRFTLEALISGEYMKSFETYVTDQFPVREKLRTIKSLFSSYVFNKKDNNGLFVADGHISKIEYPQNTEMTEYAKDRFHYLYNSYMKDKDVNIYLSLIPDKNFFLAEKNGYPSLDYQKFINDFKDKMDYMEYIDVTNLLSIDDYYKTDSHWKQDKIKDVAKFLLNSMGTDSNAEYKENLLDNPFNGVYKGQSALPFKSDTIKYLTNDILDNCIVTYYDSGTGVKGDIYNMEKAYGKDPYEMFLSGTSALIEIENPTAKTDKELLLFRDSFGSSIAPLLVAGYKKVTVVDIRYIQSSFLGNFIEFSNQDVLFLYSTTLINNSMAMR